MCARKRLSREERKKEILTAAMKVIKEKGFVKTTMEDIVSGTTLSKGGVYHYYRDTIEIFQDIMRAGIEYRNNIIKKHLSQCVEGEENKFLAKELVEKIIDENPYVPLYVEFLITKKRNPALHALMQPLQRETQEELQKLFHTSPTYLRDNDIFQFITHFINSLIIAADILEARECLAKNRRILEELFLQVFAHVKGEEK